MSDNQKLTLILTIKDRKAFIERWMVYANHVSFPFKVLIADGGKDESVTELLSDTERFQNVDYDYIRYPYDASYAQYYAKTAEALSRVKTPYAIVGQDDDFYIVDSLQWAVDFLSNHQEYIVCNGNIDNFIVKPEAHLPYGKDVEFIKNPCDPTISDKKSSERVWKHFNNYGHTYYSVYRTPILQKNYATLCKYNFSDLILHELLLSFLTVARGPVKRDGRPYLLRQINFSSSSNRAEAKKKGDYLDRMLSDSWFIEFNQFVDSVAKIISENDKIDFDEARLSVRKGYRKYLIPYLIPQLDELNRNPSLFKKTMNKFKKLDLDNPSRKILRQLFHKFQDLTSDVCRPRPFPSSPEFSKNIQPILEFLTSGK